ncbi:hypothetical protein PSTG_16834 [Puccinia striiformis f. sp. tritici PST-78]|uniref:DDE Tnp4 domain-containing protein n=1 Tax=Puccinia striiformis f. sp. tritici PST-78 TaxID=1165861 RepID=A0A0L0URJ6_9BASI|nr:hypothetical protein PSTG_16834 [Puccinia striiformis f. sp. tritici PST-78]
MLSEVFNVSEGSIENFTNRTLQAILDLEDRYVKLPTPQERVAMIDSLPKDDIFRNCVGFVDGTIIPLESAPTKNKEDYWMRKTLYALNSLLVCDRNKRIIYSFHGWCGSAHDQRVYKNSRDFNYQLSSRRVAIKQCIGIHKNQWQSLKSSRLLIWGSTSAARLNVWLRVCVILHNFLRGQSTSNWVPFESNLPEEVPSLDLDEDNLENCTLRDRLFRRFCESNDH